MKLLLLVALIKHAYCDSGFVKDVYLNRKFQCSRSVAEIFTVNSEIQCSHRCLRKRCTLMNYNTKDGEIENCQVFKEVYGCSGPIVRADWKTVVFEARVIQKVKLDLTITSYGKSDKGFTYNHVSIRVNGLSSGFGNRGFNVAVISPITGHTLGIGNFDTYDRESANAAMVAFINQYPNGSVVCIAITDSANNCLTQETKTYLASLGSVGASTIHLRSTLALLTAKGATKPVWFKEKFADAGNGPCIIEASLRF